MEQENKTPAWKNWLIAGLVVVLLILTYIINHQDAKSKLNKANTEKKKINTEIDSLTFKRDDVIETGKNKSQAAADNANQTIKTIDNEKIYFVRDTTYNAMCLYITNYKPHDTIGSK